MQDHPKYHEISSICQQYPHHARGLFQTYMDLKYHQLFKQVVCHTLPTRPLVLVNSSQWFIPVYADQPMELKQLSQLLQQIQQLSEDLRLDSTRTHLAIVDTDSTQAYYDVTHIL